jgi:DNA polymerase elongation subunit (family B)
MNTVIIDIETRPLEADKLNSFKPEFKADARLKDPVKVAEDLASKEAQFVQKAALSAFTGEICAIGVWDTEKEEPELHCGLPEKELIEIFSGLVKGHSKLVTFNGIHFDIPFLCRRGLLYGHNLFFEFFRTDGALAFNDRLIDLAAIWDCRQRSYPSLHELSLHLGIGGKPKTEELYYQMWERNQEEAKAYLRNDLFLTKEAAKFWGIS